MPYTKDELKTVDFYKDFIQKLRTKYLTNMEDLSEVRFRKDGVLYSFEDIFRDTDENFDRGIEEADINQNNLYFLKFKI